MQNRLTPKDSTKCSMSPWDWCGLDKDCKRDCFNPEPCRIPEPARRLAAYEDTCLTPEEITEAQKAMRAALGLACAAQAARDENARLRTEVEVCGKLIEQQGWEINRLNDLNEQVRRERDAAVADMTSMAIAWNKACGWCKHNGSREMCASCVRWPYISPENLTRTEQWQWRGASEQEAQHE